MKILISLFLVVIISCVADDANTTAIEECSIIADYETFMVADTFGKKVFTKRVRKRKCVYTEIVEGDCLEKERVVFDYNTSLDDYNEVHTMDYSQTAGSLINMMAGINNSIDVLSGWNGYCIEGLLIDFSWAEDPYMWAEMAMTSFMELGGSDMLASYAKDASDAGKLLAEFAKCSAQNSIDLVETIDEYVSDLDGPQCNPIDEFCETSEEDIEENTFSIERGAYNDIIESDPEMVNYITIISDPNAEAGLAASDSDIIIVEIKTISDYDTDVESKDLDKIKKDLKTAKALIGTASYSAKMYSCMGGNNTSSVGEGATTDNSSVTAEVVESATKQAITQVFSSFGGPFAGMAASIVLNVATSFNPIDTCKKKSDAEGQGGRHVATQDILKSKHPDMCKVTIDGDCVQKNPTDGSCSLHGYTYCCYDSPVARYLMAEIKAQLGKNWLNCSDLMLKELSDITMRACTDEEKLNGVDGASDEWTIKRGEREIEEGGYKNYYDMAINTFYQAKHQCLNYDKLKQYYRETYDGIVDQESLEEQLDSMFGELQ